MNPRLAVALPTTDATLTEELGHMLADSFAALGADARAMSDEEAASCDADAIVILGDILFSRRVMDSLRRPARPRAALWQLEAVPPAQHYDARRNSGGLKSKVKFLLESSAIRYLKPFILPSMRTRLLAGARFGFWRNELLEGPSETPPDGYWGFHRIERVKKIKAAKESGLLDAVFAGTPERAEAITAAGVGCAYLPIGYHEAMEPPSDTERTIDVLFLGGRLARRSEALERLSKEFAARGLSFHIEHGPIYGIERARLLGQAKISLHIGHVDNEIPRIRVILSMAARALFISEKKGTTIPFTEGKHLVTASLEEIPDIAQHYIHNERDRLKITAAAHSLLVRELSMNHVARALLTTLDLPATAQIADE